MLYTNKKVVVVGGSGFIGTQLAKRLLKEGAQVVILDPKPSPLKNVTYIKTDLRTFADFEAIQSPDIVFNLAGAPIFARWNKKNKQEIYTSRINTVRNIVKKFNNELYRPKVFVSTSAIGVYGDRGDLMLDENSKIISNTYLAQVAYDWELEAFKAKDLGIEVKIIRNAHVLGKGGMLGVLKKIFNLGIGGLLGDGKQYMSFVSIEKCIDMYVSAPFKKEQIKNAVSMQPLTNREFSKKLATILRRPCFFRIPVLAISFMYGDFAKEIMASQRVYTVFDPKFENIDQVIKENT